MSSPSGAPIRDVPAAPPPSTSRESLLQAARRVFEDRGYFQARITDITGEAGLAAGSFYTHFQSKESVFDAVATELVPDEFVFTSPPASAAEAMPWLREQLRAHVSRFVQDRRLWLTTQQAALGGASGISAVRDQHATMVERLADVVRAWRSAGIVEARTEDAFLAQALASMAEECLYHWYLLDEVPPPEEDAVNKLCWAWQRVLRMPDPRGNR